MPIQHTVVEGECLFSIAYRYGFFPATVWDAPENQELRTIRNNPAVLAPGDVVVIPDRSKKTVSIALDQRHRLRRKGVPERLQFQFLLAGHARADEPYELEIDGVIVARDAMTDGEGRIDHRIVPNARTATVRFTDTGEHYSFVLGRVGPIDSPRGILARLCCLGLYSGPLDGVSDAEIRAAVARFQAAHDLPVTGEPDDATQKAIEDTYGG